MSFLFFLLFLRLLYLKKGKYMSEDLKEGWICPVCKTVKAPALKSCKKCSKQLKQEQGEKPTEQLLTEA